MKLKGFTLAEVLITLTIVGVVAALTLPSLNVNSRIREYEAGYGKVISDLSNINKIVMSDNSSETIMSACGISSNADAATINNTYLSCISNYYGIVPKVNPAVTYSNMPDGESGNIAANSNTYFLSKNRNMGLMPRNSDASNTYKNVQLYVDLNGPSKGPNRLANDLHIFIIEDDGGVYGYGSVMTALHGPNGSKYASRSEVNCNASEIKAAKACTGSITDNGGKIVYKLP